MLSLLPTTLLGFLFASPVFSQVSNNDPFRAIVLSKPKAELQICSLKPLTPLESVDEEVLLSFEEWKKKQLAMHRAESPDYREKANHDSPAVDITYAGGNASDLRSDGSVAFPEAASGSSVRVQSPSDVAPHFRVPITDRFNYADIDCSARVHTSHRSAKSSSSILSSKKDRYMLSPCDAPNERQFVAVELCDDVRIDTVQLANFEFFSGVFKDFTVSVAKTYTTDPDGWTFAGTYRAKNVRGVQSFHPPTSLKDFYRFIRIDFLSHYGNEYYCPVSLLRVYGLTHLEEWKWDIWHAESRAKLEKGALPAVEVISASPSTTTDAAASESTEVVQSHFKVTTDQAAESIPTLQVLPRADKFSSQIEGELVSSYVSSAIAPTHASSVDYNPYSNEINDTLINLISTSMTSAGTLSSTTETAKSLPSNSPVKQHTSTDSSASFSSTTSISSVSLPHEPSHEPSSSLQHDQSISHSINKIITSTTKPTVSLNTTPSSSSYQLHSPPPIQPPPTGESVYRTIMNRLTALENNQTLYMQYVEQQNGALRDVIRRLGEDLGRLETIVSLFMMSWRIR
jgi:hypothetical protein